MAFIDLTSALETVDRSTLWKILGEAGCPSKLITIIRLLHDNMNTVVLFDGEFSLVFEVKIGVVQGCVLAPTLFSIFLPEVIERKVREKIANGTNL